MLILDLINKTSSKSVAKQDLSAWIENELEKNGFDDDWQVEVMFVDDTEIKALNKKYRKIDKATDVLSFPQFNLLPKKGGGQMLGSIVVSIDQAQKQAADNNRPLSNEIEFLVRHSTKHLIGIHHD